MIELLCTLAGIIAGIAVVASIAHYQGDRGQFEVEATPHDPDKIRGIADQLQLISHRVAANVSAHSQKVENFSDSIGGADDVPPEHLASAIDEIIAANQAMQTQLDKAKLRIEQQSQIIEQTSQQARTDALTGLSNRRALDEFLTNCISSQAKDEVVGLLLLDIDHFKNFNDSFGHTTGDAVLASFARSITKCCGDECYAARFGGEEFAIVLTAEDAEELARKAAAVRRFVSEQVISYEDLQLKITSSAGMCILLPEDTINSAYERSDEGLYQAKKSGRNCGFWLAESGWQPFPDVAGEVLKSTKTDEPDLLASEDTLPTNVETGQRPPKSQKQAQDDADSANPTNGSPSDIPLDLSGIEAEADKKPDSDDDANEERAEILDLKNFLERLEPYLEQLRRASLPATALMVEAVGLDNIEPAEAQESWDATIALVQKNLRGIDVVCQFRRNTLCIFMPGCSQDVCVDRAAQIQTSLIEASATWESGVCPERLAIALASVEAQEESSTFLNRLELALDEAHDASATQIVIHNGDGCHFQEI